MQKQSWIGLRASLLVACGVTATACGGAKSSGTGAAELGGFSTSMHGAAVRDSLRQFADSVTVGVSRDGPAAWRRFMARRPEFWMAVDGDVMFPDGDSAMRAIDGLVKQLPKLELKWASDVRLDAVAPGLGELMTRFEEKLTDTTGKITDQTGWVSGMVENGPQGWRFRNLQWVVDKP